MHGFSRVPILVSIAALAACGTAGAQAAPSRGFAEALKQADSLSRAAADSASRSGPGIRGPDSAVPPSGARTPPSDRGADSLARGASPAPRNYGWKSPYPGAQPCPDAAESASLCWRGHPLLANQDIGFPGPRAWTLSLTRLEPIPVNSPFFPAYGNSPYLAGGMLPPEQFSLRQAGGNVTAIEEVWSPVVPLDTPATNLEWERGALALNMFHLKLERMLSDRVYLGMDYYSATADSQTYDYQFNVHQPYLGGWGFLGQIYAPIDRDSASLVLEGYSHSIEALDFRPRVGFWVDTGHVLEIFMDRLKNATPLTLPRGPGGTAFPGRADSIQSLMPSRLDAYTGGAVHALGGEGWSSQWDVAATALEKSSRRNDTGSATGGGFSREDEWNGKVFRLRGRAEAPGLPAAPYLEAEARSEVWQGRLFLHGARGGAAERGWTDRQALALGIRPDFGWFALEAEAGMARGSAMDARVFWLPRGGAFAEVRLPLGLEARGGGSYEMREPDWEAQYRHNPALFRYPSPGLKPREDLGYRGSVSWTLSRFRLGAGADVHLGRDVWLPMVLPDPEACPALDAAAYGYAGSPACADGALGDSLALRLRNWDVERRAAWHMGLGFDLGYWSLDLENRFVFVNEVEDPLLGFVPANRMIPDRVFKGNLGWRRALLGGRMKLDVGWGWEWFSTRYAWVPDLSGRSRAGKLDEYLALDFHAGMRIRSFLLHFRGVNLNHDRYATEPGVHPPGVNFRFGVDWTIWN